MMFADAAVSPTISTVEPDPEAVRNTNEDASPLKYETVPDAFPEIGNGNPETT
jgi:hypothetical protein